MCVINNCDKVYCLHFSMAVRERVALFIFIAIFILINCSYCLPRNLAQTPKLENKVKQLINVNLTDAGVKTKLRTNLRKQNIQAKTMNNVKQECLREKFNFPEIEYPTASTPKIPFHFRELASNSPQKCSPQILKDKNNNIQLHNSFLFTAGKNRQQGKIKKSHIQQKPEKITMSEFSSAPNYRDMGMFPEVEYPQNAKDMWRPNYWNYSLKEVKSTVENSKTNDVGVKSSLNHFAILNSTSSVNKTKSAWSPTSQKIQKQSIKQPSNVFNRNQTTTSFKNQYDATNADVTKKESHSRIEILPEVINNCENLYTATPMPQGTQKEDLIKTALYAKIYSNIANKAFASIKNILKSDKSTSTTENYGLPYMKESDILDDILRYSHPNFDDYDTYSQLHNNYYATTPRTPREFSYSNESQDNVTQSWINVFTAFTEKPGAFNNFEESTSTKSTSDSYKFNHYSQTIKIDNTSSSHLTDVINIKPDATTLSPRVLIYDDRELIYDKNNASILGQCNECDVSVLDKIAVMSYKNDTDSDTKYTDRSDNNTTNNLYDSSLKLDDDYTTDVYPEINDNGSSFVLSTVAPFNIPLDDLSWANSEIIDPYKSISYPDELEEYYIAVG